MGSVPVPEAAVGVDANSAASQTTHTQADSDTTAALILPTRVAAAWGSASTLRTAPPPHAHPTTHKVTWQGHVAAA